MIKISILGATSHIAKNLIYQFNQKFETYQLNLFARNLDKLNKFLNENKLIRNINTYSIDKFSDIEANIIINCIGVGTPSNYKILEENILSLNERYDNIIIDYLYKHPETKYIYLSSGAIYGKEYSEPINENTELKIKVSSINESDFYLISKLYTETKHRALKDYSIIDLRVFSFFSRFVDLDAGYLLTDILNSIIEKKEFHTNSVDIYRDYVHPEDLFQIVELCLKQEKNNTYFDVYSAKPIKKSEILDYFTKNYNLKIKLTDSDYSTLSGCKSFYYTEYKKAKEIGYEPKYTSLECIDIECGKILGRL